MMKMNVAREREGGGQLDKTRTQCKCKCGDRGGKEAVNRIVDTLTLQVCNLISDD